MKRVITMTMFVTRSPITGKSHCCAIPQDLSGIEQSFWATFALVLKEYMGISLLDQRGENIPGKHVL